jgi:hypothetical protein
MKKFKRAVIFGCLFLAIVIIASAIIAYIAQTQKSMPWVIKSSTPSPVIVSSDAPSDGYGIFESCSPHDASVETCLSHLNDIAAAGFKLVINYDMLYGDISFQEAYFNRAQSLGMKVILPLNNPAFYDGTDLNVVLPDLAATCNCSDDNGLIKYLVNLVKKQPALWGYYIGDEVDPSDHDAMKSKLADVVRQQDPNHPRLFIDEPARPVSVWRGNSPFFDTSEVIGTDFYPVRKVSPDYPTIDQMANIAYGTQAYASAHKEDSAIVLQAYSRSNYGAPGSPYPTAEQMNYMLSQTLKYSYPRIILWYSYYDTMSSDNPQQHWNDLKATIARHMPKKVPLASTRTASSGSVAL